MKTRNGFVSNSSSSSFIIAIRKQEPCPHCGRKDPGFLDMIERSENYSYNRIITGTIESTLAYIELKERSWMDEKCYEDLINSLSKYEGNNEWAVANVEISNHDETLRNTLSDMIQSGSIEVLRETEG